MGGREERGRTSSSLDLETGAAVGDPGGGSRGGGTAPGPYRSRAGQGWSGAHPHT